MNDIIKFPGAPPRLLGGGEAGSPRSIKYRRRAARLGRLADAESDEAKMLPLIQQALSWIQLAENEEFLGAETDRPLILVVEDELLLRRDTVHAIESAGFEVAEAANADEAIRLLETRPNIAVIFTDIVMPGSMDGIKLAAAVRDRWPPIKIITTSGFETVDHGQLPEGGLFLPKPYSPEQIVGRLRELVS